MQVNRNEYNKLLTHSKGSYSKNNNDNLRERTVLHTLDNKFIGVEENINGWFTTELMTFGQAVHWVNSA